MQEMSAQVKRLTDQADAAKQEVETLVARLPNLPDRPPRRAPRTS